MQKKNIWGGSIPKRSEMGGGRHHPAKGRTIGIPPLPPSGSFWQLPLYVISDMMNHSVVISKSKKYELGGK